MYRENEYVYTHVRVQCTPYTRTPIGYVARYVAELLINPSPTVYLLQFSAENLNKTHLLKFLL